MIGRNNPFNIRYNPLITWVGQESHTNGFCDFSTVHFGVRAACLLLMRSYRRQGFLTIQEIISRFAPPSENNTSEYVQFVCHKLGIFPFDIPSQKDFPRLLHAMSIFEGNPVSEELVADCIEVFKIRLYNGK